MLKGDASSFSLFNLTDGRFHLFFFWPRPPPPPKFFFFWGEGFFFFYFFFFKRFFNFPFAGLSVLPFFFFPSVSESYSSTPRSASNRHETKAFSLSLPFSSFHLFFLVRAPSSLLFRRSDQTAFPSPPPCFPPALPPFKTAGGFFFSLFFLSRSVRFPLFGFFLPQN